MHLASAKPQECLFIDDLIENIQAAELVGIKGIHFKSSRQLKNELLRIGILDNI